MNTRMPENYTPEVSLRISRVLRHSAEIELCLEEEGREELVLSGPLIPSVDLGGILGAERAYTIADDGRVEMLDAPVHEARLYDLLPADTDAVIVIEDTAKLYTVQLTVTEFESLL